MKHLLLPILCALVAACATTRPTVNLANLKGDWWSNGPSFDMVIYGRTILFEFDMKEHPYRVEGNVLVIDFQDPSLGIQRKRIVRLTADELEIEDITTQPSPGGRFVYHKGKPGKPRSK